MLKTILIIAITTSKMLFPDLIDNTQPYQQMTPASKTISIDLYSNQSTKTSKSAKVFMPKGFNNNKPVTLNFVEPEKIEDDLEEGKVLYYGSDRQIDPAYKYNPLETALNLPKEIHYCWPGEMDNEAKMPTSVAGSYRLDTNFAGTSLVNVNASQEYMDELEINHPLNPDFTKPVNISWKKIPGALAYVCYAIGGKDTTTISWNSSPYKELPSDIENNVLLKDKIDEYIKANVFLSPEASQIAIPANIFNGCDVVLLSVVAFGADSTQYNLGVTSNVIVRSITTSAIKSGKRQMGTNDYP